MSKRNLNYVTLFSSAGVGCHGFKMNDFDCIVTNELLEKRLNIQRINNICKYNTGYVGGDIKEDIVKNRIYLEIERFKEKERVKEVDVLIATPPCQGMSVANHKKKNEKNRNSLIIESIKIVNDIKPKFFIFENVRAFLKTTCTDVDNKDKGVNEAIDFNLGGSYNILYKVINFKDYGNNSSRTRTLVIGSRKDLKDVNPYDIFPDVKKNTNTLKKSIGHLKSLKKMGEVDSEDVFHRFRPYSPHMLDWIKDVKEGQSAFDNKSINKKPHRIVDEKIVINKNKNGDKYKRCEWNKIAPCIHTRNDILSSQSTIHPKDNRVFSIRELMELMTIPKSFKWLDREIDELNLLTEKEKDVLLKKEEINIRQSIGEAVPTVIFEQIASKIKKISEKEKLSLSKVNKLIKKNKLENIENILNFINKNINKKSFEEILKTVELSNAKRLETAAFYTQQDICFNLIKELPEFSKSKKIVNIIEPSVGIGNFLPLLFKKYEHIEEVNIDLVDIDDKSIKILRKIIKKIDVPNNFKIKIINQDFLKNNYDKHYDIAIGNPPFGKIKNEYKKNAFIHFIEKCLDISDTIALICPKSFLSAPSYSETRELLVNLEFKTIIDYGEKGFSGVKIETIGIVFNNKINKKKENLIKIESYISKDVRHLKQKYLFDKKFPFWIIYRNNFFDKISKKLRFDIFEAFRDRQITKKHTLKKGKIRVLKSRNIAENKINNIDDYDCYINEIENFNVKKFLNEKGLVLIPNLTYKPRACFLPKNTIVDGSVAILKTKENLNLTEKDLEYYSSEEFRKFYMICRNLGTRSLNIDSNSVFFLGLKKQN